jgi:hypothetical protein
MGVNLERDLPLVFKAPVGQREPHWPTGENVVPDRPDPSRASRGSSCPVELALGGESAARKRGHQDTHTLIRSDDHMRYWRRGPTTCQATETTRSACRNSSPPTVSRPRVAFDRQT